MGLSAVVQFIRSTVDSLKIPEVQVTPSAEGVPVTAEHYAPPGVDAVPLPDDTAAYMPGTGSGRLAVVAYMDTRNAGTAAAGEHRIYARDADGNVVASIWLKGNGDIELRAGEGASMTIKASGDALINGVTIDSDGNITTPGDVTVKSTTAPVTSSTHQHPTAMGPSGSPTPGT